MAESPTLSDEAADIQRQPSLQWAILKALAERPALYHLLCVRFDPNDKRDIEIVLKSMIYIGLIARPDGERVCLTQAGQERLRQLEECPADCV